MKKPFLLLLCAVLLCALCPAASADVHTSGIIDTGDPAVPAPVYAQAQTDAPVLGRYYNGLDIDILQQEGDWCQVRLGDPYTGTLTGWLQKQQLSFGIAPAQSAYGILQATVQPTAGTQAATLRTRPDAYGTLLGRYSAGARLEVLGDLGEWYHVRLGYLLTGFMPKADVAPGEIVSSPYTGLTAIGYAVLHTPLPGGTALLARGPFPNSLAVGELRDGISLELLADLGAWAQVRSFAFVGFVPTAQLSLHPIGNLTEAGAQTSLAKGEYLVGRDLPAGLYTFHVAGGEGSIEVRPSGAPWRRTYAPAADAHYTLYLPERATVSVRGAGTLTDMAHQPLASDTTGEAFTGTGRYLVGGQLVDGHATVRPLPGVETGYYVLSTMQYEEGMGEEPQRVPLRFGSEAVVELRHGMFIELIDCVLIVHG